MQQKLDVIRKWSLGFIVSYNMIFFGLCVWIAWPFWWMKVNFEHSPITWLSSVQLILCAIFLSGIALIELLRNHVNHIFLRWSILAAGFLFLSLDEFFQIHERLREGIFIPHEIGTNIPLVGPGDFLLLLYALVGIFLARWMFKQFALDFLAKRRLLIGVCIAGIAVLLDALSYDAHENLSLFRQLQFLEEVLEMMAQSFMLAAFISYFFLSIQQNFQLRK